MKNLFEISIKNFKTSLEIEGAWKADDYKTLLEMMDYEDVNDLSDTDLKEVCIMSLQDNKPDVAAQFLLKHRLGSVLKDGQIKNISSEMQDEKLWEEYADPNLHEELFNIGSLLYQAFSSSFPKPDVVKITFEVKAKNAHSIKDLKEELNESFLIRVLADGMEKKRDTS